MFGSREAFWITFPPQPALDIQPELGIATETPTTWFFTATMGEDGPLVEGHWSWTETLADFDPSPCQARIHTENEGAFSVGATEYVFGGTGTMNLMGAGCVTSPFLAMASAPNPLYPVLRVQDPTITGEAVMLIPPVPGPGSSFSFWGEDGQRVSAALISLSTGPQTKADCMGGGWESFGFKNQGQCVRYIETGKDSR